VLAKLTLTASGVDANHKCCAAPTVTAVSSDATVATVAVQVQLLLLLVLKPVQQQSH
jgi:hypothetical protein